MKNLQLGTDLKLENVGSWLNAAETDVATTESGDLAVIDDRDNVRQALLRRFNTPVGVLWAHPEYGNPVWDILSEGIDDDFLHRATDGLRDCILQEPRVELISISYTENPEARLVIFDISYKLLNDTRVDNLNWELDVGRVMDSV